MSAELCLTSDITFQGLPAEVVTYEDATAYIGVLRGRGQKYQWEFAVCLVDASKRLDDETFLQVCADHQVAHKTFRDHKRTVEVFLPEGKPPRLNWNLDFSHYVTVSGLPEELQEELLDVAESGNYAVEDLLLSIADMKGKSGKTEGAAAVIIGMAESELDALTIAAQQVKDLVKLPANKPVPHCVADLEASLDKWHPANRKSK
jgi:hypothetical protein